MMKYWMIPASQIWQVQNYLFHTNGCAIPPTHTALMQKNIFSNLDGIIAVVVSLNPAITPYYYFSIRPLMCWPSPEIHDRNLSCLSSSYKEVVILRDCLMHVPYIVLYNLLEFDVWVCVVSRPCVKEILSFGDYSTENFYTPAQFLHLP